MPSHNDETTTTGLFTRPDDDGERHLTELSAHRLRGDELTAEERVAAEAHLSACGACRARLDALDAQARELSASPLFSAPPDFAQLAARRQPPTPLNRDAPTGVPSPPRVATASWGRRAARWAAGAATACAALIAVLWLGPWRDEPFDTIRIKGQGLGFAIHLAAERGGTQLLTSGDTIHPGARLGFVARPVEGGHILVVGVDANHSAYPCSTPSGTSSPIEPQSTAVQLPGAVEMDDVLGREVFVAVRCPEPFSIDALRGPLEAASRAGAEEIPRLREGCAQEQIALTKRPPEAP